MVDAKTGNLQPFFWNSDVNSGFFRPSLRAFADLFTGKKGRNAFSVTEKTIKAGIPEAGGFHHMSFDLPVSRLHAPEPKGLASATTVELAEMLDKVLADNQTSMVHKAADLLLDDKVPYADKHKRHEGYAVSVKSSFKGTMECV